MPKKQLTEAELQQIATDAAMNAVNAAVNGEVVETPVAANDAKMGFWTKAIVAVGSTAAVGAAGYVAFKRFMPAA